MIYLVVVIAKELLAGPCENLSFKKLSHTVARQFPRADTEFCVWELKCE